MATISRIICDVHLTRGEEVDATSRSIEMDGNKFRVDLCDSCYQENIQPVVNFIERLRDHEPAEKVPAKKAAAKKSAGKRSRGARGPSAAAIRNWAQEQGIEVSASGRVPREVREQYLAAH
jgi:hypothetical protein